jgi:glycosyltransferase involved in cell wall biosynthesis
VKIAILAAGAGGMYCGSCMRDNTLASALLRRGHEVTLIPLYTPLRTDTPSVAIKEVFYGGVNVYLQHATRLFRKTPRLVDWLLDSKWLVAFAGRLGASASPSHLGALTVDILRGEEGPAVKELRRLLDYLLKEVHPEVVSLPNLMFVGLARLFGRELGLPVVCELTGEDMFLDVLEEQYKTQARDIIRQRAADVSRFVATSSYYAQRMSDYLGIARDRIDVVYSGLPSDYLQKIVPPPPRQRPPTVGYLARVCPEKGLERLVDAMLLLHQMPGMEQVRLQVAGYLSPAHRRWFSNLRRRIAASPLAGRFHYVGEVDQAGKRDFFQNIDLFSVPTVYEESKGIYILESLAHGVPVVQPNHGAFPELIERTGGGVLVQPGDAGALAAALAGLLADAPRRAALGLAGKNAVFTSFTDDAMAHNMLDVFAAAAHSLSPVRSGEG